MTDKEKIIKLVNALKALGHKNARRFLAFEMELTIPQWSAYSGIAKATISNRILQGWSVEKAVTLSATNGNNQFLRY